MAVQQDLLLKQAHLLSQAFASQPIDRLRPFAQQLNTLSTQFTELYRAASEDSCAPPVPPTGGVSSEYLDEVRTLKAFSTALTKTRLLEHALEGPIRSYEPSQTIHELDNLALGPAQRETDILGVLSLRPQGKFSAAFARRRIQLLCACVSVTRDFSDFERSCGYVPKKDQLISAISSGRAVAVQRIGRRLGQFLACYRFSPVSERKKKALDAAIRLGTKLEILDAMENEVGLEHGCLSLLMGLDCATLSRLSYSSLGYIRLELSRNSAALAAVTRFNEIAGEWWSQCLHRYHERQGSRSSFGKPDGYNGFESEPHSVMNSSPNYYGSDANSVSENSELALWPGQDDETIAAHDFSVSFENTWQVLDFTAVDGTDILGGPGYPREVTELLPYMSSGS